MLIRAAENSGLTTVLPGALSLWCNPRPSRLRQDHFSTSRCLSLGGERLATLRDEASGLPHSRLCDVGMSPRQNGFHQLMKPSHHEPGNNVVSRNRLGRSGRFPIIVISSERVPPRSKRPQELVPEQDFFGDIGQVSEHVRCIASPAGGVIDPPGAAEITAICGAESSSSSVPLRR